MVRPIWIAWARTAADNMRIRHMPPSTASSGESMMAVFGDCQPKSRLQELAQLKPLTLEVQLLQDQAVLDGIWLNFKFN